MRLDVIPDSVRDVLGQVTVDPGLKSAAVDDREIDAETPRQLRRLLANALYEKLHTGGAAEDGPRPLRLRDHAFERSLAEVVPHQETMVQAKVHDLQEGPEEVDRRCLVGLEGVRVWVPYEWVRHGTAWSVGDVVTVANTSRRPALSPGFFLVQGTRIHRSHALLRVYVHIADWEATAGIWGTVLACLEREQVAYRAKVLSSKELYPRRDALVVYLDAGSSTAAQDIADCVAGAPGTGAETSAFTHRLRDGVAAAWEPDDDRTGMAGLSFGQHRATVLAEALVDAVEEDEPLADVLHTRLLNANVDPTDLSRNQDSPPIAEVLVPT